MATNFYLKTVYCQHNAAATLDSAVSSEDCGLKVFCCSRHGLAWTHTAEAGLPLMWQLFQSFVLRDASFSACLLGIPLCLCSSVARHRCVQLLLIFRPSLSIFFWVSLLIFQPCCPLHLCSSTSSQEGFSFLLHKLFEPKKENKF